MHPQPRTIRRESYAVRSALSYLDGGFAIIPLIPRGKSPLNKGGCNAPIKTVAELERLARLQPDMNFGVITGVENRLVVIDIDGDEGERSLRELEREHGDLPLTFSVATARGRHLYFDAPQTDLRNRTKWVPGVDVRANGGYVVGAGSVHETGARYCTQRDAQGHAQSIASLPDWLDRLLRGNDKPKGKLVEDGGDHLTEGERNAALTRLAGHLRNANLSTDAIEAALLAENASRCHPSLEDAEVERIAASVSRYPIHAASPDTAENIMETVLAETFAGGRHLLFAADGQFWRFQQTHWHPCSVQTLKQIALTTIQNQQARKNGTSAVLNQTVELLKAKCADSTDHLGLQRDPPRVINCENGELWIDDNGGVDLRPHDPESYLRHCFAVRYDATQTCPQYDQALLQIFGQSGNPGELADFWDELMGFIMQPSRKRPIVVVGKGSGSNGKTGLVNLLISLLGNELVAALPVQSIEENRFTTGSLEGKLLLLDDDVKAGTRLPDGPLKRLSEEKTVTGEHKYGPSFQFKVRTVPILLCNGHPSIADLSHGMQRRLVVVPFDQTFPTESADIDLFKRIARDELSGVLNCYVTGLQRLIRRDWCFATPESVEEATKVFVEGANPVASFVGEACERTGQSNSATLYSAFGDWCDTNGITYKKQRIQFRRDLEHLGFAVDRSNHGQIVRGLSLRRA